MNTGSGGRRPLRLGHACRVKHDPPRPLSARERLMLDLLLSSDFAGVAELREQARSALVVGRCDCGCPSVDLQAVVAAPAARLASRLVPSELEVVPVGDKPPGQVILLADDGRLSCLGYVFFGQTPAEWPDPSRVRVVGPPAVGAKPAAATVARERCVRVDDLSSPLAERLGSATLRADYGRWLSQWDDTARTLRRSSSARCSLMHEPVLRPRAVRRINKGQLSAYGAVTCTARD